MSDQELYGQLTYKIDSGGRVVCPYTYKGDIYLLIKPAKQKEERCLYIMGEDEVKEYVERIKAIPASSSAATLTKYTFASITKVTPDKTNKIAISQKLRAYANIESEIVYCHNGQHTEIWNPANFAQNQEADLQNADAIMAFDRLVDDDMTAKRRQIELEKLDMEALIVKRDKLQVLKEIHELETSLKK